MKILILFGLISICAASSLIHDWVDFKVLHGRRYRSPVEEQYRFKVFLKNQEKINEHNKRYEEGLETYHMGMNHFGDWTEEEVERMFNNMDNLQENNAGSVFTPAENAEVPDSIDWRKKGAVTPVKDQAECGSCWAFSTTGSLEGQMYLKKGKLVSLSEQNLVDCVKDNNGCGGGWMDTAFKYIKDNGGIDAEDSYPYEGRDGKCRFNKTTVAATVSGYTYLPEGDEEALKKAVATVGPISIAFNALGLMFYERGIYYEDKCPEMFNHAVLVVGYGTENGTDYWLLKNSWGAQWGEEGYARIARNKKNMCGVSSKAGYPVV